MATERDDFRRVDWQVYEWRDPKPGKTNTAHLPDEVVATPFSLMLDMRTAPEDPRIGGMWVSLNFGGILNPVLTADQVEYIIESVRAAIRHE